MEPSVQQRIDDILGRARAAGFDPQRVDVDAEHVVHVTYRSRFRLRWVASRLHVFTFITGMDRPVGHEVAAYGAWCTRYAREHKPGLPLGLQSGAAAIPMIVTAEATDESRWWAQQQPPIDFGVMTLPVLVDAASGAATTVATRRMWGAMYDGYLRDTAEAHVGAMGPRPPWPRAVKVTAVFSIGVMLLLAAGVIAAVVS